MTMYRIEFTKYIEAESVLKAYEKSLKDGLYDYPQMVDATGSDDPKVYSTHMHRGGYLFGSLFIEPVTTSTCDFVNLDYSRCLRPAVEFGGECEKHYRSDD